MKIRYHPDFKKAFKKRIKNDRKLTQKVEERIDIFIKNPNSPIIKDHKLVGGKKDHRSFWITGDIRIIYFPISKDKVLFIDIGTHNQVY